MVKLRPLVLFIICLLLGLPARAGRTEDALEELLEASDELNELNARWNSPEMDLARRLDSGGMASLSQREQIAELSAAIAAQQERVQTARAGLETVLATRREITALALEAFEQLEGAANDYNRFTARRALSDWLDRLWGGGRIGGPGATKVMRDFLRAARPLDQLEEELNHMAHDDPAASFLTSQLKDMIRHAGDESGLVTERMQALRRVLGRTDLAVQLVDLLREGDGDPLEDTLFDRLAAGMAVAKSAGEQGAGLTASGSAGGLATLGLAFYATVLEAAVPALNQVFIVEGMKRGIGTLREKGFDSTKALTGSWHQADIAFQTAAYFFGDWIVQFESEERDGLSGRPCFAGEYPMRLREVGAYAPLSGRIVGTIQRGDGFAEVEGELTEGFHLEGTATRREGNVRVVFDMNLDLASNGNTFTGTYFRRPSYQIEPPEIHRGTLRGRRPGLPPAH